MMKFNWLLLSFLSVFLFCSPAQAGRLLFWRFDQGQNRLVFSTEQGVQPTAQLIFNPTRVVIDLPGTTLGRPSVTQPVGGLITQVKVGQFDSQTTRLVIELANGYTVDPLQVKVQGVSPTQWTVNLPQPQRVTTPAPIVPNPTSPTYNNQSRNTEYLSTSSPLTTAETRSSALEITKNGLFLDLQGRSGKKITINRSRNRREISFRIEGLSLPSNLLSQSLTVNNYGVSEITFNQKSSSPPVADITLNVNKESPDWQASFSREGGLVFWPKGGINAVRELSSPTVVSNNLNSITPVVGNKANIQSVEVTNNQLLIRADSKITAQGNWNYRSGEYEIKISGAQLPRTFRNPQLSTDSPIYRLRLWQPDSDTVMIVVQPSQGVRFEQLNQASNNLLTLSFKQFAPVSRPTPQATTFAPSSNPVAITPIPPSYIRNPEPVSNTQLFPNQNLPPNPRVSSPLPQSKKGKILVVIDPGHGGKDPGAIGIGGIQEKNIILPIGQQIAQILEKQGIQVQMTRNSDYFVTLQDRTKMANAMGGDIFVSIHANSMGMSRPDVNGLETYYFGRGKALADTVHRNILARLNVRDRRVRSARFYVIRTANMPAILVETGYVTGAEDSAKLSDPNFRSQMAQAIAFGILEYIKQNKL